MAPRRDHSPEARGGDDDDDDDDDDDGWGSVEPGAVGTPRVEAPRASAAGSPWRPGQGVFHNKFGEGVIVTLEGGGEDARAQVNFGRHGVKWLALAVARLTPLP